MTDFKFVPLNSLENRLGDALGLAIAMIRDPNTVDNKAMAQAALLNPCPTKCYG